MPRIKFMRIFYFIVGLFLIGCTKNTDTVPDENELSRHFNEHHRSFKKLRSMIISDSLDLDYFQIREGKIGEYDLTNKGWSKDYGHYVPFSVAAGTYRLTSSRFDEYVKLLKSTNATAVDYYNGNVSISIFPAGFVFGGCISEIIYQPDKISLSRPSWATTYYQAYFNENWGAQTKCN